MLDIPALRQLLSDRFFAAWDGFVRQEFVDASEQAIRGLVGGLIALGPDASDEEVQDAVERCVETFNNLDSGWIATIEREDICDRLETIVELCGMDSSADWVAENREW